jgi:hypothetical protein
MAAVKNKLGRIPCDCCGHPVVLKENEAGTLTVSCDECDVSSFAKKGTAAAKRWRAKLPAPEPVPKAPAPEVKKPAPAPAPEPVPKAKANAFDPLAFLAKPKAAA